MIPQRLIAILLITIGLGTKVIAILHATSKGLAEYVACNQLLLTDSAMYIHICSSK